MTLNVVIASILMAAADRGDDHDRSGITGDASAACRSRNPTDAAVGTTADWPSRDLRPSKWGPAALLGRPRSAGTIAYTQEGV